jgi:hypothetical protein
MAVNYKKEISNKSKSKIVIITRTKLSDGYNYYLMLLTLNPSKKYVIDGRYKQKNSILSEASAIKEAKSLL